MLTHTHTLYAPKISRNYELMQMAVWPFEHLHRPKHTSWCIKYTHTHVYILHAELWLLLSLQYIFHYQMHHQRSMSWQCIKLFLLNLLHDEIYTPQCTVQSENNFNSNRQWHQHRHKYLHFTFYRSVFEHLYFTFSTTNATKIHRKCQHLLRIYLAYCATDITTYVD